MTPYRLILSRSQWEDLPSRLDDPFFAALAVDNRKALAVIRTRSPGQLPVPMRLDDPESESLFLSWRVEKVRLLRGTVAWWLDRQQADADDLRTTVDYLLSEEWDITETHKSCGLKHLDLCNADLGWCAAFAMDVLPDVLGAERVARLRDRLITDILPRYLQGIAEREWWYKCNFNWAAALHGNMGFVALAIQEEAPELAAQVLVSVKTGLQYVCNAFTENGGWFEGLMYQTTTLGHLTDFIAASVRCTGDDLGLRAHSGLRDCFRFRQEQLGGDGRPLNFSNINEFTVEWTMSQAYWWADQWGDAAMTAFEDAHSKPWWDAAGVFYDIEAFWYRKAHQPAVARPTKAVHHFTGLDWLNYRGPSWWCAVRAGRLGENHGNQDLGQVIIGRGATRWLIDPGYRAQETKQHNLPTVRGYGQVDAARGSIIHQVFGDDVHVAMELAQSYPNVVEHWIRHVLILGDQAAVVIDDMRGADEKRLSACFHLQTRGVVTVNGSCVEVQQDDDCMHMHIGGLTRSLMATPWTWVHRNLATISWNPLTDLNAHRQVVVLADPGVQVATESTATDVTIMIGAARWRLSFEAMLLERVQ